MNKVLNFSRHPFNSDQVNALQDAGYDYDPAPRKPFFKDGADFLGQVKGCVASAVVPSHILLDALQIMSRPGNHDWSGSSITLISWTADQDARSRGRFATTGMVVTSIQAGPQCDNCWVDGNNAITVGITLTVDITPTVENDFKTGQEFARTPDNTIVV